MLVYLIKLLFHALINHGTLLTFLVKNDVYACLNLNEKRKIFIITYTNLKNKQRIDLINAKAMFKHDKFISM